MALSYVDHKLFQPSNLKCMISFNYNKIVKGCYQIISMTGAVLNLNFSFSNSLLNTPYLNILHLYRIYLG